MKRLFIVSIFLVFSCFTTSFAQQLAFPGAEGFGAYTKGGRGGEVFYVTNLNNEGPGSLRYAVEQTGPRTVVFAVSGIIDLTAQLLIENPYITIAGQTAPGDGICLRGETLRIEADQVIIRYLRVRLGDGMHGKGSLQGKDAISISSGKNIIIDHCSASWSLDEVLSASCREPVLDSVTVQWCFITEALNPDKHGYGSLIRGTDGAKYSFLYNLYAHNTGRNPRPGNYDSNPYSADPKGLLLDFRNNVIYNWGGSHAGYNSDKLSVTRLNFVNNYLVPGANSKINGIAYSTGSPYNRAYFANNYYNGNCPVDQWELVSFNKKWTEAQIDAYKQALPFETGFVEEKDVLASYKQVLLNGGASLPRRDKTDSRIVESVMNRTGSIIKSQNDVGGWEQYNSGLAPIDTDRDGIPDFWENQNNLDQSNPEDSKLLNYSGFSMLEEYLNSIHVNINN